MSLADPFTLCILAIVALSFLGLPIGHAMIGGSILYLWLAGLDMGTAAEQLLNGMYTSYILLAVPLFIFAAEIMNSGSHDRAAAALLRRAGRPLPRRPRPGQRRAVDHLRRHVGLGDRRRRRQRQADADDDDLGRQVHPRLRRRADRRLLGDRPDHPAVDPDGGLRPRLRRLDRLPLHRRHRPRPADGPRPDGDHRADRPAPQLPGRRAGAAPRDPRHHHPRLPGADDAGRAARLHLLRRHHPDRGRRHRRRLRLPDLGAALPRASRSAAPTPRCCRAPAPPPRSAC